MRLRSVAMCVGKVLFFVRQDIFCFLIVCRQGESSFARFALCRACVPCKCAYTCAVAISFSSVVIHVCLFPELLHRFLKSIYQDDFS